jgi:hypothetical protein
MHQVVLNFRNIRNTQSNLNIPDTYVDSQHFRLAGIHAPFDDVYVSNGHMSGIVLTCKIHVVKVANGVCMTP